MSQDSAKAWKLFHEHSPPPAITSIETWGEYAASLYTVPGQSPLPKPLEPCPETCTFFIAEIVKKAIDKMKTRKAYDHDGLVAKHFIHANDVLAKLLMVMFDCVEYEGLHNTQSLSIVPIFNHGA